MSTIFSAYDIRGRAGDTLTNEQAWNVGKAFAEWLPYEGAVIVFKTAGANQDIAHALIEGVLLQGRDVINGGEGDGQAVIATLNEKKAVAGISVDHSEAGFDIITLFDISGATITDKNGLTEISNLAESGNLLPAPEKGQIHTLQG
jgi:phosphomannomutase